MKFIKENLLITNEAKYGFSEVYCKETEIEDKVNVRKIGRISVDDNSFQLNKVYNKLQIKKATVRLLIDEELSKVLTENNIKKLKFS